MRWPKIISLIFVFIVSACAHQQLSYQRDIKPIINNKCNACHLAPNGDGYRSTGLTTGSYDDLMRGSVYGPVIVAGDSQRSILNMLAEGRVGNVRENHKNGGSLSAEEIKALRDWVNQGALDN